MVPILRSGHWHSRARQINRKQIPGVEVALDEVPTISADSMYLHEKGEHPTLMAVDHTSGRVMSYALPDKSILTGDGCIQKRFSRDVDNVGHKDVKIMIQGDQEHCMVALQHEVQRIRTSKTVPVNSPVGESECNGRVGNAIRRVQDRVRKPKCQIECETGMSPEKHLPIMTWIVRWAGEFLSKYSIGVDRKTAYERIRGRTCDRPIAYIGGHVWYKPLNAPATDVEKVEPRMLEGAWLGVNERTEEQLIGTKHGVVKCRTVERRPQGSQWNAAAIAEMKGTTWQPTPGMMTGKVLTAIPKEAHGRRPSGKVGVEVVVENKASDNSEVKTRLS